MPKNVPLHLPTNYRGTGHKKIGRMRFLIPLVPVVVVAWLIGPGSFWPGLSLPELFAPDQPAASRHQGNYFPAPTYGAPSLPGTTATTAAFITGLENLPAFLQDTAVEDNLRLDDAGNLMVDVAVRNLFDYFLALNGREPLSMIEQRIQAYLQHRLPPAAAARAEALLRQYLAYKLALHDMQEAEIIAGGTADIASVRTQMALDKSAREQHFSAQEAEAFFQDEDAFNADALARLEIITDPDLDAETRAERLAELDAALPAEQQQARAEAAQLQQLLALAAQTQDGVENAEDLQQLRTALAGTEAAERLQALDQERQAWARRVLQWQQERTRILEHSGLAPEDAQTALQHLRNERFDPAEQLRLAAVEATQDQTVRAER